MSEIIAKSKTAKRERAKEKEADDEQLDALDLTFKALADVRPCPCRCCALPRPRLWWHAHAHADARNAAGWRAAGQPAYIHGPHAARQAHRPPP
jgi:hypothetical protein